jgi:DNA-binding XRE family transcriptional regulator
MQGLISLDEVMASWPKERRELVEAMGAELAAKIRERMTLAELRRSRKLSQSKMAEALGIGQMQISRLERRKDPRLSTIQRTVAAMGGHLTMIATFPDQEPVVLFTAHSLNPGRSAKKRSPAVATRVRKVKD